MQDKTTFETDIMNMSKYIEIIGGQINGINNISEDGISVLQQCNVMHNYVGQTIKNITKYEKFLKMLKSKYAYDIRYDIFMSQITRIINSINQIRLNVANSEFKDVKKRSEQMKTDYSELRNSFAPIMSLPYVVDFSNISQSDWRLIGIQGIHYRSKIFLSYPFRDNNPHKDENQKMIDTYLVPLLESVNIQPITARMKLNYQDLIDDNIINLIQDCDGIIALYTENDAVENIEHELSFHTNIIAICMEEGAKILSMRYSRLMINFNRGEMGFLIMEVLKALKNKNMFYLTI